VSESQMEDNENKTRESIEENSENNGG